MGTEQYTPRATPRDPTSRLLLLTVASYGTIFTSSKYREVGQTSVGSGKLGTLG